MPRDTNIEAPATSGPPPIAPDIRAYIEDQLDSLAALASARGERRLAVALQMAALEAARSGERS